MKLPENGLECNFRLTPGLITTEYSGMLEIWFGFPEIVL